MTMVFVYGIIGIIVLLAVLGIVSAAVARGAGETILAPAGVDPIADHAWGCRCPGHR